jgi:hypothetical protein
MPPPNIYRYLLISARFPEVTQEALLRIFGTLNQGVAECQKAFEAAQTHGDADYIQSVADDESDVLEALIGTALVVAQTEIESAVKMVKRLHQRATSDGHTLVSSKSARHEILKIDSPMVTTTNYTRVEVINAFANYFKHRDGWEQSWNHLTGKEKFTVDVIVAAGAKESSSGNLRTALDTLGIQSDELEQLYKEMSSWKENITNRYRSELTSLGLW